MAAELHGRVEAMQSAVDAVTAERALVDEEGDSNEGQPSEEQAGERSRSRARLLERLEQKIEDCGRENHYRVHEVVDQVDELRIAFEKETSYLSDQITYHAEVLSNLDHKEVCDFEALRERIVRLEQRVALPKGDERLQQVEEAVAKLQSKTEALGSKQQEIVAKVATSDHHSLRMERSIGELRSHVEAQLSGDQRKDAATCSSPEDRLDWFQDVEMGTETLNGYSLMRGSGAAAGKKTKRHKNRSESRARSRHEDDPGSSDSSTSSSSSSDTDDSGKPRKSRKRDTDSSSDSDASSDRHRARSGAGRRKSKLLDPKYFGAGRRRASIIGGDEPSERSSGRGTSSSRRHSAQDSIIFVQPSPVVQTLKLSAVSVGKVMYFCKTFNSESSRFRGGLNASNYIDDRLLCQMRQVALKHDLPGQDGILNNGMQKVTNKEIFAILAMMVAPTSKEEMQRQLAKSVWPQKEEYKTVEQIMRSILDYKTELLIYVDASRTR